MSSFLQFRDKADENTTVQTNLTTFAQNTSSPDDCITVRFSDMEFIPWDNPQNIVSAEVEAIVSRLKNNLLALLFLIGGPANVINMAVFYKQGLRDRVNLCLFALSLADELFMVSSIVYNGEQLHVQFTTQVRFGPLSVLISNTNMLFLLGSYYVSHVLSAIIATERCLCIYNPLKFQSLLKTKTMAVIVIVVYTSVLGTLFVTAFRYRVGCVYDPVMDVSVLTSVGGEIYQAHKQFFDILEAVFFGFFLPVFISVVVITTTIMTVVKLRHILKWRSETTSSISAHELALTKTLVVSSIFFIVCLVPGAVNRFSWLFFPEINSGRRHHNFFLTALWLNDIFTYINSTFNFFVYYTMGSRFRETFRVLFCRKKMQLEN